jgi:D-glycero-alpha-D-manno-heptose 1-phosphate guanylyltransferase
MCLFNPTSYESNLSSLPIDCVIIAGGAGTRVKGILGSVIKPMVDVNGKPFLHYLVEYIKCFGIWRFIFAVGNGADQIESYFGSGDRIGVSVDYSHDGEQPLGTGGAVKQALQHVSTENVLIVNGDTLCLSNYRALISIHQSKALPVTMLAVFVNDIARFGSVILNAEGQLVKFEEKKGVNVPGLINGGVYVINKKHFLSFNALEVFSLERDYLEMLPKEQVNIVITDSPFIDFGVAEDLKKLPDFIEKYLLIRL